ncbi:acetyltransferase [Vibrio cholerae]|nr:acetyltransferase [Vibrio cholerae]
MLCLSLVVVRCQPLRRALCSMLKTELYGGWHEYQRV